jgi:hypothetical protein
MTIEEGPGGHNEDEDEGRSAERDVQGELDVLKDVSDDEGDRLGRTRSASAQDHNMTQIGLTPIRVNATFTMSSASFCPSKSLDLVSSYRR